MSPLRLTGSTSGYSEIDAPAVAGDQTFTLPGSGGVIDTRNRAGNILQVVSAEHSTNVTSSVTSYADTGLSASITPSSASSKILVLVTHGGCAKSAGNAGNGIDLKLLRDGTDIYYLGDLIGWTNTALNLGFTMAFQYLDSPATTSSVTYKTQFANRVAAAQVEINNAPASSIITLMEVAA